jgi:hypothetical protein
MQNFSPIIPGAAQPLAPPTTKCQACGVLAATRQVTLQQNIGALVVRFPRRVQGELCRTCIDGFFWRYTLTTFFLGWWGMISFVMTPIFIISNIVTFISTRSLPRPGS